MARRSKLDLEIDDLFQQPLDAFVRVRNALADRLKDRGDEPGAAAIRATPKPNVPAWVVNRLVRESKQEFRRLVRAGEQLACLQRAGSAVPGAASLRKALEERRAALASLRSDAERLLADAGASANKTTMRKIEATLEALGTWRGAPSSQEPGRLTRDLDRPGFDVLLDAPPSTAESSRVRSRKRLVLAAVRRAEKEVARRRSARDAALVAREAAESIARESGLEVDRASRRLASLRKRHEKTKAALSSAKQKAKRAGSSLTHAEDALREARDALDE